MFIRQDLETLLKTKNSRKSDHFERDLQIILEYFGLGEEKFPTQESLGKEYGITRQYVSKDIIETKFKNKIQLTEFPILTKIHEELQEAISTWGYIFYSDILLLLIEKSLINDIFHLKGLLNLLECFDLGADLDIYTTSMSKATKKDIIRDEEFLIVKKDIQQKLKKEIQNILKLPGRVIGICCLDDVYEKSNNLLITLPVAKRILQNTNTVWCKEVENKFWYLVENRENPIITNLGKIKNIGISYQKEILVNVIDNAMHAHSLPLNSLKLIRPNKTVIESYLDNSRFIALNKKDYIFQESLDVYELSEIELDVIEYFKKHSSDTYKNILNFLKKKNRERGGNKGNDILKKNCFNSPFLYKSPKNVAEKKGERYDFFFIQNYFGEKFVSAENDYQAFRDKLLDLYGQTDLAPIKWTQKMSRSSRLGRTGAGSWMRRRQVIESTQKSSN